ncbi:hypothetical protein [Geotalea uraniireducens]|uniref:hypothetical protein n=1 Tax=Geotalea uraniireducens TaxID=351604 RepID=UPI0002DDBF80|nr:hypothetical protein [Geotalea uraniireducens]
MTVSGIPSPCGRNSRHRDRTDSAESWPEPLLAKAFRDRDRPEGDLVFYDITSTWFDGDRSLVEDDFRRFGYSRDGRFDRRQNQKLAPLKL